MPPLLTPEDVANLLNMSVKTVYAHARRLGGFFPAGIKVLRFSPGVINGIMEGQNEGQGMAIRVPIPGDQVQLKVVSNPRGSSGRAGRSKKIVEINGWKTDPSRHGL